jgi:hypothetical protein
MCASFSRILPPFIILVVVATNSAWSDEPAADATAEQRIQNALANWEAASRDVEPPTEEDEHVAYVVHKSKSSGHEIAVALEFQGPVRAEALQQKYRWTRLEENGDVIRLHAEPIEAVERLFCRGFEVELDAAAKLPTAIRFIDKNGKPKGEPLKLAVKMPRASGASEIVLTSAEEPSPTFSRFPRKPLDPSDYPLDPDLTRYKVHWQGIAKHGPPACPSLIGLSAKDAADVLKKCNYDVSWKRGEPAKNDKLVWVVYEQTPRPGTPLRKGEKVTLKVYDKVPHGGEKK